MRAEAKAVIIVPLVILLIMAGFIAFGYVLVSALNIPLRLGFLLPVRMFGVFLTAAWSMFIGWVFRFRRPKDVLVSMYITFSRVRSRVKLLDRKEPLIIQGPYRYVRHPLYFGVVLLAFGCWLLLDYSFLAVWAVLLLLWFNFVIASFEEAELKAIFGEQYKHYSNKVPKMIPFKIRKK
ncbi:MAG: methyltransferase [Nitrososphaerota archaeon]